MTVIVKMMSGENAPDSDTRKLFILFTDVYGVHFKRDDNGVPSMELTFAKGYHTDERENTLYTEEFDVTGNVYVMNEAGKTISSFGACPLPAEDTAEYARRGGKIKPRRVGIGHG